jgi:cell division septum initiation protein DivIVA
MADSNRVPDVKRDDFLARLDRARKAGGYTEDSVHQLVDTVVANTNAIIGALNDARDQPAAPSSSSAEAERIVEEARALFESQSRTAAEYVSNAQARAAKIEADAEAHAAQVRSDAESSAQELTDSTNTWAGEVRRAVEDEIAEQRAAAEADLEDVRARRERLAAEANDIVTRLGAFYETQLNNLHAMADGSATGGSPLVADAQEEEVAEATGASASKRSK